MRVFRILHGAGNTGTRRRESLGALARHPAVDAVEADVWVHGDAILAHHERPLGPLPWLVGWNGFRRRGDALSLHEILEAAPTTTAVIADLRSWIADPVPELARALAEETTRSRIRVTCEDWRIADRLRAWLPDIHVGYSIRSEAQFRAYLAGVDAAHLLATPVAVRHTLLHSADEVALIRRRAGRVGAWTVDDVDRALELVAWGVDEVTSNHVSVLNAL